MLTLNLCLFFVTSLSSCEAYSNLPLSRHYLERKAYPNHAYQYENGFYLKNGKEITVHLVGKSAKEYHFNVGEDHSNVRVVVTPCGGTIKWKLVHLSATTDYQPGSNEIFANPLPSWRNGNPGRGPHTPLVTIKEAVLLEEVGDQSAMEYSSGDNGAPAGLWRLYVSGADRRDVWARIFISASSPSGSSTTSAPDFFPTLPRRKRPILDRITKTSVSFSWSGSPDSTAPLMWREEASAVPASTPSNNAVKYCAVLSKVRRYAALCQLEMELKGHLNEGHRRRGVGEKSLKRPKIACTSRKSSYFFDRLKSDTKYHLSLFAINTLTGGSAAYDSASFVTRTENLPSDLAIQMHDGRMYATYLNPTKWSFQLYEFSIDEYQPHLTLTVQPCTGYVRVSLCKDGVILRKSIFDDLKTFMINNVEPGLIKINVTNDDSDAKLFKIWASVQSLNNPYPRLPSDTSLKALENGRSCRSVELVWLTVDQNQRNFYCLYKRQEEEGYFKQLILEQTDQCKGPASQSNLVFCKTYPAVPSVNQSADNVRSADPSPSPSESILSAVVDGLEPSTTYRFDLYVSKHGEQQLSYRTVWVTTKPACDKI